MPVGRNKTKDSFFHEELSNQILFVKETVNEGRMFTLPVVMCLCLYVASQLAIVLFVSMKYRL